MTDTIALISAITALCAVLLGPLVALWSARRQSHVAVLATNRQTWINTLRELIAECMSISGLVHLADWSQRPQGDFEEKMERLSFLVSKIRLMINPEENDHQRLVQLLGEIIKSLNDRKADVPKDAVAGAKAVQELVPLSQAILKREWERVKRVE